MNLADVFLEHNAGGANVKGVDISLPALSLLEGQKRPVSDIELKALAEVLQVDVRWLLGMI